MKNAPTISALANLGYTTDQINRMLAASGSDGNVVHATGDDDATTIAAASRGLCKMTPLQAAAIAQRDAGLMRIWQFVQARAKRYGISLDKRLDIREIDAALKAANVSSDDRWLFKGKCRELRLV